MEAMHKSRCQSERRVSWDSAGKAALDRLWGMQGSGCLLTLRRIPKLRRELLVGRNSTYAEGTELLFSLTHQRLSIIHVNLLRFRGMSETRNQSMKVGVGI